jgi:hypothetical protein
MDLCSLYRADLRTTEQTCYLQFQSNRYPIVTQIVTSGKQLKIATCSRSLSISVGERESLTVWDQLLDQLVNLFGLLTLPSPLAEDYVRPNIPTHRRRILSLHSVQSANQGMCRLSRRATKHLLAHETRFLRVLEVETMTLSQPAVDCVLHPCDVVDEPYERFIICVRGGLARKTHTHRERESTCIPSAPSSRVPKCNVS